MLGVGVPVGAVGVPLLSFPLGLGLWTALVP